MVRLSDLYAVSLDALLKEEAPMSDYLDYLEESTNTVRSRREQSLLILLCVYLGIWAVSVLFFCCSPGQATPWATASYFCGSCCRSPPLLFHCSLAGADTAEDKAGCCRLYSARCICSPGYATFMLANMLSVGILRLPQPSLLLKGTIISAAGFWFGALTRRRRRQRGESGE